jgi:hypothetical protein
MGGNLGDGTTDCWQKIDGPDFPGSADFRIFGRTPLAPIGYPDQPPLAPLRTARSAPHRIQLRTVFEITCQRAATCASVVLLRDLGRFRYSRRSLVHRGSDNRELRS